jgi:hypothetical protein
MKSFLGLTNWATKCKHPSKIPQIILNWDILKLELVPKLYDGAISIGSEPPSN